MAKDRTMGPAQCFGDIARPTIKSEPKHDGVGLSMCKEMAQNSHSRNCTSFRLDAIHLKTHYLQHYLLPYLPQATYTSQAPQKA